MTAKEETRVETTPITLSGLLYGIRDAFKRVFSVSTLFVVFKYLAFIGFTAISAILSVNMFMRLSSEPVEQFALVTVAITLEFFKIFSIVRGNTLWRIQLRRQAIRAYTMYLILAVVAIMASYGFTLTVINRNIEVSNASTIQLQITNSKAMQVEYAKTLASLDVSIKNNQDRLATLPEDYVSATRTLNDTIAKLQLTRANTQSKLEAEKVNEVTLQSQALEATKASTTTVSMFKLMADGFKFFIPKISENSLMLFLLLLISVIIELGIISTSPSIPIDPRHLKHFLDEMSALRAEEMLAVAQGRKKKDIATKRLSLAGRIAQRWMDSKNDVRAVLSGETSTPPELPAPRPRPLPALRPTEATIVASVPLRRTPEHAVVEPPAPKAEPAIAKVDTEVVPATPKQPDPEPVPELPKAEEHPAVPLRSVPAPAAPVDETVVVPEQEHKVVEMPRPTPPQAVADTKTYRFGKTTTTVKNLFVTFVSALFDNKAEDGSLADPASVSGVSPSLAATFISRLCEIKGSKGNALIEKRDGKLYPNYTREYIISYSTAEAPKERIR